MNKKNRIILLAAMIVAAVSQTFAQGNGLAGINEATSMVTSYFDPGTKSPTKASVSGEISSANE